ncbi:MAG TPA: (2Fe-2S) ferredoxin domain-containing protein [Clostridia bacterium]|jgi:NADH:ubiquinone oxidoreductase subunit E|nr:(2Fe-2S) ferredoxin domain-containing protein [Clostridia bacterium]
MVELTVCIGTSCHLKGSYNVLQIFQQMVEEYSLHDKVALKTAFCTRECAGSGVAISINGQAYNIGSEKAREFFSAYVFPLAVKA